MQVQVNVIFDLETEADRVAIMTRIDDMLRMSGIKANMVPLAGNGTDEAPMRVGGAAQAPDPAPAKTPSPGRVAAAANARAAKQQAQQQKIQLGDPQVNSLAGAQGDIASGINGGDQAGPSDDADDSDDALGLNSPSMSPGEAKDQALALVREAYSAGHVAQVKALQKELGVAKFYDVDVTNGHAFYQRVMKLSSFVCAIISGRSVSESASSCAVGRGNPRRSNTLSSHERKSLS